MICLDDKFNKTTKTKTECLFCHDVICRECLKQSLVSDSAVDVCCPGCRAVWSQDFLLTNLPVTFRTGPLKKHREKVLFDREKVQLPLYMDDAKRYKTALDSTSPLRERLDALKAQYHAMPVVAEYKRIKEAERKAYAEWMNGKLPRTEHVRIEIEKTKSEHACKKDADAVRLKREISVITRQLNTYSGTIRLKGAVAGAGAAAAAPEAAAERRIVMACPVDTCAGFVNTLWKCGMCDTKICKECRRVKTDGHACVADDVATAHALAAETKPCPKCAASISKVSGCDQMWCTLCHTTFSWTTGKVEVATIHNPHYFQWLAANGKEIPRADLPGMACNIDEMINTALTQMQRSVGLADEKKAMCQILLARHMQRLDMEHVLLRYWRDSIRRHMEGGWRRELCVSRLAGEISESQWRILLQRAEKAHHKERAWVQLMEMYAVTTRDILGRVTQPSVDLDDIFAQHNRLREFVREQNMAISKAYQCIYLRMIPDLPDLVPEKPKKAKAAAAAKPAMGGAGGPSEPEVIEIEDD
jgi:hypothetical protein